MNLLFVTAILLIASVAYAFYIVFSCLSQRKRLSVNALTNAGLVLYGKIVQRAKIISGATGKIGLREENRSPLIAPVTANTIMDLPGYHCCSSI